MAVGLGDVDPSPAGRDRDQSPCRGDDGKTGASLTRLHHLGTSSEKDVAEVASYRCLRISFRRVSMSSTVCSLTNLSHGAAQARAFDRGCASVFMAAVLLYL